MKVFFDTEFEGLYKNSKLISIGFIDENGRTFYGEISNINYKIQDEWIKQNVLANTVEYGGMQVLDIVDDENDYYIGDKDYIKDCLETWFSVYDSVELVSDVSHFDMVLLIDIFGHAFNMPKNICPYCYDINQLIMEIYQLDAQDAFDYSRELILEGHNISIQGLKHNSMYDARVIKEIYQILINEMNIE